MLEHTAKPAVFRETSWHRDSSSQGHVQTITKRSPYTYRVKEKPFHLFSDLNFFSSISCFYSFCPCASIGEILYFWQGSRAGWAAGVLRSLASVCVSSAWAERRWEAVLCGHEDLKDVATSPPHCPAAFSSLAAWGMCFNQEPSPQPRSERCQSSLSLCHSTLLLLAVSHPHRNTPSPPVLSLSHSFSPHPFLLCWQIRSPPPFFR